MDPIRRLTLALLLASVAALGASADDVPMDADRAAPAATRLASASEMPWRLRTPMAYDERRCTERRLGGTPASLVELVRRP